MSGILYGALLPRDVVLGLDNSTREPACHSSPYLGQFMLLRKLTEPFSDLLLGAILSKLYSGWICKALSFNFPNLWKLAAWGWIERISWENCAQGYRCDSLPACTGFQWSILSGGPCVPGSMQKPSFPPEPGVSGTQTLERFTWQRDGQVCLFFDFELSCQGRK